MKKVFILILLSIPIVCFSQIQRNGAYYYIDYPGSASISDMIYRDSIIESKFYIANDFIGISIKNISNKTISIIWDKSTLCANNRSDKTAIIGVAKTDYLPDIIVPPGTFIEEKKLTQQSKHRLSHYEEIYNETEYNIISSGIPIELILPIEYNKDTINYIFIIRIKDEKFAPQYLRSHHEQFIKSTQLFSLIEINSDTIFNTVSDIINNTEFSYSKKVQHIADLFIDSPAILFPNGNDIFRRKSYYLPHKIAVACAIYDYFILHNK